MILTKHWPPTSRASASLHRHGRLRACTTFAHKEDLEHNCDHPSIISPHHPRLSITANLCPTQPQRRPSPRHLFTFPVHYCHPFLPIERRFVTCVAMPGSVVGYTQTVVSSAHGSMSTSESPESVSRTHTPSLWKVLFVVTTNQTGSPCCETHAQTMVDRHGLQKFTDTNCKLCTSKAKDIFPSNPVQNQNAGQPELTCATT